MARCCLLPKDSFHSIAPSIMALPQEEMVPQSQLVLCTAIEEIPRPSRHLSEPEDHLFNLPCSKQVSAIHRDALQEVNKAVCQVLARTIPCKRGSYKSKALDPAQRCEIGKCASEHVRKRTYQFHIAVQDLVLYSYKIPLSSTCQNLADCPVYSTFAINKHEL